MSAAAQRTVTPPVAKDLYGIGEIPPLGHVPERMHAWVIRKERLGPPEQSMQIEVVPTWPIRDDEVLVHVMAGGVNYNGIWAALGQPVSVLDVHKHPFHIAGFRMRPAWWLPAPRSSAGSWATRSSSTAIRTTATTRIVMAATRCCRPAAHLGLRDPDGSFAQFCRVQSRQLMMKPKHLTLKNRPATRPPWPPPIAWVRPSAPYAQARRQCADLGRKRRLGRVRRSWLPPPANAIGIISTRPSATTCFAGRQGRRSTARTSIAGPAPPVNSGAVQRLGHEARRFARRSGTSPASATSISCSSIRASRPSRSPAWWSSAAAWWCSAPAPPASTSPSTRYVWMRQKRIQGSHFAHLSRPAPPTSPCSTAASTPHERGVSWSEIALAHMKMWKNQHPPGNMAVLVNAPRAGLRNLEDTVEASGSAHFIAGAVLPPW